MLHYVRLLALVLLALHHPHPSSQEMGCDDVHLRGCRSFVLEMFVKKESKASAALILPQWALAPIKAFSGDTKPKDIQLKSKLRDGTLYSTRVARYRKLQPILYLLHLGTPYPQRTPTIPIVTRFETVYRDRCTIFAAYNSSVAIHQVQRFISVSNCPYSAALSTNDKKFCVTTPRCFRTLGALMVCKDILVALGDRVDDCTLGNVYPFVGLASKDIDILKPIQEVGDGYLYEDTIT
ncbi:hypothetical protein Trydic_g23477 [Trypoxylus dichotomus]